MNDTKMGGPSITLMGNRTYDTLKLSATLVLPALAALYFGLAQIWGFPYGEEVTGTIVVVNTFLGVLVKVAGMMYQASGAKYGGTLAIEDNEETGSTLRLKSVDPLELTTKDEITLKILRD